MRQFSLTPRKDQFLAELLQTRPAFAATDAEWSGPKSNKRVRTKKVWNRATPDGAGRTSSRLAAKSNQPIKDKDRSSVKRASLVFHRARRVAMAMSTVTDDLAATTNLLPATAKSLFGQAENVAGGRPQTVQASSLPLHRPDLITAGHGGEWTRVNHYPAHPRGSRPWG